MRTLFKDAPEFDFAELVDENPEKKRVAQRPRANVPPPMPHEDYYNDIEIEQHERSSSSPLHPPRPLQTGQYRRPSPTGSVPVPPYRAPAVRPKPQPRYQPATKWAGLPVLKFLAIGLGVIMAAYLAYLLISTGLHAWQVWQDDLTYGRPRTMQVDQFVGHGEAESGRASHFIAQNVDGQITVVEYPGGDVSKTRVFPGPRLFGKDSELVPVKIHFQDVNGDGHVDMVLSADNQLLVYINQDGTFRPITAEERARYQSKLGGGP